MEEGDGVAGVRLVPWSPLQVENGNPWTGHWARHRKVQQRPGRELSVDNDRNVLSLLIVSV